MVTSTHNLSKEDLDILVDNFTEEDEILVDRRKGVPQTKYLISVNNTYFCYEDYCDKPTPDHLRGYWMQEYQGDNRYKDAKHCLENGEEFVKCRLRKVETWVWEAL